MKIKANASFFFESSDNWENAVKSIKNQIVNDMNVYYQNDDETQLTEIKLGMQEL